VFGLGFFLVALGTGSVVWLALSLLNVLGACGDLLIAALLLRHREALFSTTPANVALLPLCGKNSPPRIKSSPLWRDFAKKTLYMLTKAAILMEKMGCHQTREDDLHVERHW
jgi:hypothetical protein